MSEKGQLNPKSTLSIYAVIFQLTIFCVSAFLFPNPIPAKESIPSLTGPESFARIAEMAGPAVVNIRTERITDSGGPVYRHYYKKPEGETDTDEPLIGEGHERKYMERSLGSGFILDQYGHIATNHHVIFGADRIKVRLHNGREYDADIVGSDPLTDLALIKIESKRILPVFPLGNSENVKVGQWVAAIGSPFGLEQTLTVGIVSAKGRVIGLGDFDDFIQTDASINPGNSGGPLLNVDGEVIGVNTAIFASSHGIGFAVPINIAKEIFLQLKKHGEVSRGWLGIVVQDLTDSLRQYSGVRDGIGVMVSEVYEGNPADDSGIEVNDIIREINGKAIKKKTDMGRVVSTIRVGDIIDVRALRDGKEYIFKVKVGKREDVNPQTLKPSKGPAYSFGIKVNNLTDELSQYFKIMASEGVVVEEVDPDGKGQESEIKEGDLIKEINHQTVTSLEEYKNIVRRIRKGEVVQMLIHREKIGYMVVELRK